MYFLARITVIIECDPSELRVHRNAKAIQEIQRQNSQIGDHQRAEGAPKAGRLQMRQAPAAGQLALGGK